MLLSASLLSLMAQGGFNGALARAQGGSQWACGVPPEKGLDCLARRPALMAPCAANLLELLLP